MSKFAQFFQEDNGTFSATRLAFLTWIFGVLLMWGVSSFQSTDRKMQEIPSSVEVLIGVLMTGKVVQKFQEEQPGTDSAKTTIATPEQSGQPAIAKATNGTKSPVNLEN